MSQSYTVRSGETLSALARRFGTTVDALARANGIKNPDRILAGQRLTIPDGFDRQRQPVRDRNDGFDGQKAQRTEQPTAQTTAASKTSNGYRSVDPEEFLKGGTNSKVAIVVGTSEGTRTETGGRTRYFHEHTDPGNQRRNQGSFSYQHGAPNAEAADQAQIAKIRAHLPAFQEAAKKAGLDPNNALLLATYADLYTQSERAAKNFIDREMPRLAKQGATPENIIQARVRSYNDDKGVLHASGFDNDPKKLLADQTRRTQALERALTKQGYRDGGSTRATTGAKSPNKNGATTEVDRNDKAQVTASKDLPQRHVNVPYYSQFEGGHGFTPGKTSCFLAATAMAKKAGATTTSKENRIQVATGETTQGRAIVDPRKAEQGRRYIDSELDAGRPVVVGVTYKDKNYNADKITDHFVVITGRGVDAKGRAYYTFHDPATGNHSRGRDTNPANRFYVDEKTGNLYRPDVPGVGGAVGAHYDVSMVRPNAESRRRAG